MSRKPLIHTGRTAQIYCAEAEFQRWNTEAKAAGLSLSAWVRKAVAEYQIVQGMTAEEFAAYKDAETLVAEWTSKT